jgi:hypothetical protein
MTFNDFIASISKLQNGQFASIGTFLLCMIIALALGLALTGIYRIYFVDADAMDSSLGRSLTLLTPALAVVFLIIQTSISLSVGVLGSLAFVRFRTPVKRAEDVIFILFALVLALLCSTGMYHIAAMFVGLFLAYAWGVNLMQKRFRFRPKFAVVTINTRKSNSISEVADVLSPLNKRMQFISSRSYDGITSYVANVHDLDFEAHSDLQRRLKAWDDAIQVNIFYPSEALGA